MIETKTSQQRAENSCVPLRTPPACSKVLSLAKGWRAKRKEKKRREREKREKQQREKRRILFRIPTATKQVRSFAGRRGTVNRQKIYWSSPRRLSVTFIAPQYFPPEIQLVRPLLPSCSLFFLSIVDAVISARARVSLRYRAGVRSSLFFSFFFF